LIVVLLICSALFMLIPVKTMSHPPQWRIAVTNAELRQSFGKTSWTLALSHEPAPWSVMPLNLFRDQLILTKPAAEPKDAIYDVYLYPSNLSSQIGLDPGSESVDWARNRTQMLLGSLPPRTSAPSTSASP
jgi:hypothetical protein